MIHKLRDMLDVLRNPGKYEAESGPQFYVLPWKKHYMIDVRGFQARIPRKDDALLLREPEDWERENLIDKYEGALDFLLDIEMEFPVRDEFTEEEHLKHERECTEWFHSWMAQEEADREKYGDDEDEEECEELPY